VSATSKDVLIAARHVISVGRVSKEKFVKKLKKEPQKRRREEKIGYTDLRSNPVLLLFLVMEA
tara:strand:+ start:304 stop:492 length:189 start_codon:yes stop_codon:yes gene_type:complete